MKAILEFELPEDQCSFNLCAKGVEWALVASDMDERLRNDLKYMQLPDEVHDKVQDIRDILHEVLTSKGLSLEDIE